MSIFPYRMRFSKRGRERFLSHLDLQRLFLRAIRRADLPIRFSEGFTPRPALAFPLALGVGLESVDEILEIELGREMAAEAVASALNAQLPEGVRILLAEPFARADRMAVASVEYEVLEPPAPADWAAKAAEAMARTEIRVHRERGEDSKPVDIRPFLGEIREESGRLILVLKVTPRGSARPQEVLQALGLAGAAEARILKRKTNLLKVQRESPDAD